MKKNTAGNNIKYLKTVLSMVLIICTMFCAVPSNVEAASIGVNRIAGNNRYETSQAVATALAKTLKAGKFKNIVIAKGSDYPDALSGTFFAISKNAPILLVDPKNPKPAIKYIRSNIDPSSGTVFILGGKAAIPKSVEASLNEFTNTKRVQGNNRYATNLELLSQTVSPGSDILICSGKTPYDALGAASTGKPILLVDDSLTSGQKKFLNKILSNDSKLYIIGGPGAVSDKVAKQLSSMGKSFSRVYGKDRYDTALEVAKLFFPNAKQTLLASGDTFADSLSGAVLANARNCPLLLSSNSSRFQAARNYIVKKKIPRVTILGGSKACATLATGMDKNGSWYTGFFNIGNDTYYSDKNYILERNNIFKVDGSRFHANSVGAISKNKTFKFQGASYSADKKGKINVTQKVIYLTFDDGPTKRTWKLTTLLNKYGAKATFFVVPSSDNPYLYNLSRLSRFGHTIGNHTYNHDWSDYLSPKYYWNSVAMADKVIKNKTGKSTKYIRFIGGTANIGSTVYSKGIMKTLIAQAEQKGYIYFDWNVEANDAGSAKLTDSTEIYKTIINGISGKDSAMVLCHETNPATIQAIEKVLIWGKNNGYKFLAIDDNAPTYHHDPVN